MLKFAGKHRGTPRAATYRMRSARAAQLMRFVFPDMDAAIRLVHADDVARRAERRDARRAGQLGVIW